MAKKKSIDQFEWKTLVAAWRYYEHRQTIGAASYPFDIIEKYFNGDYDAESCKRIASQFAETDHGIRGVEDWNWADVEDSGHRWKSEYHSWLKFYAFCKAFTNGFKEISVYDHDQEGTPILSVKVFFLETTGRWYPVEQYLAHPALEAYIDQNNIVPGSEPDVCD